MKPEMSITEYRNKFNRIIPLRENYDRLSENVFGKQYGIVTHSELISLIDNLFSDYSDEQIQEAMRLEGYL